MTTSGLPFKETRRFVVHGRMPQQRTPHSGFFSVSIKEDSYYLAFSERSLLLREGARGGKTLEILLYFLNKGYFQNKRLIETVGFTDMEDKVELYIQYARLPAIDPKLLEIIRQEILQRAEFARTEFMDKREPQASFDQLRYELCDKPITYIEFNPEKALLQIKARAPFPPSVPPSASTKRARQTYFNEYEDMLCSETANYIIKASEILPQLETVEIVLTRMEPDPVEGLRLVQERGMSAKESGSRLFGKRVEEIPLESKKERKQREKEEAKLAREEAKKKKQFTMARHEASDVLFDGSLPYETTLLTSRVTALEFNALNRSKVNYSARKALEQFELRLNCDDENLAILPVEAVFEAPSERLG